MDGVFVSEVDLFARTEEARVPVFTATGLTNGSHTLTIEATGLGNAEADKVNLYEIVVDAFDVPALPVSRLQDMDPGIAYTAGWARGDAVSRSGGTSTVSSVPGAQATLTFSGTEIGWIGSRGPDTGIARVFLDGSFAGEIDTYSPGARMQDAVFAATGLTDALHTLTIEVTGTKNAASTGTRIDLDAFEVTTPGTRFQETDRSVTYSGDWEPNNRNRPWNEGTATVARTAGAQARFTFTGTSVSWIGFRAERTGIARVYLDGVFVTDVDTYAPTEGPQNTLFKATGLANGEHTLTIEMTGRKNPASTNAYVVVDAFDVTQ
jgi:bacillopeptidase F